MTIYRKIKRMAVLGIALLIGTVVVPVGEAQAWPGLGATYDCLYTLTQNPAGTICFAEQEDGTYDVFYNTSSGSWATLGEYWLTVGAGAFRPTAMNLFAAQSGNTVWAATGSQYIFGWIAPVQYSWTGTPGAPNAWYVHRGPGASWITPAIGTKVFVKR